MGLDMYLEARKHIEKIDWSKLDSTETRYSEATFPQWDKVVESAGLDTLVDRESIYGANVSVVVAYWRKANQIHGWFVDNVQEGNDNCREYYVSHDKLRELVRLCTLAVMNKDPNLIPPQEGFFFGGTDIDGWYWGSLMDTIDQIQQLINRPDFDKLSFYYTSSW